MPTHSLLLRIDWEQFVLRIDSERMEASGPNPIGRAAMIRILLQEALDARDFKRGRPPARALSTLALKTPWGRRKTKRTRRAA